MKIKSTFDVYHTHRSPRPSIRLIGQVICKDVKSPREEPKVAAFLLFANCTAVLMTEMVQNTKAKHLTEWTRRTEYREHV